MCAKLKIEELFLSGKNKLSLDEFFKKIQSMATQISETAINFFLCKTINSIPRNRKPSMINTAYSDPFFKKLILGGNITSSVVRAIIIPITHPTKFILPFLEFTYWIFLNSLKLRIRLIKLKKLYTLNKNIICIKLFYNDLCI